MPLTAPSCRLIAVLAVCLVLPASTILRAQGTQQRETTLRDTIVQQPTNAAAYLDLAKLYIEQGRFDEAVAMITNALAITRQQAGQAPRPRPQADIIYPDDVVRVGGEIMRPEKVRDVPPVYPADAQEARVQGVVIVEALIGRDGRVQATKVLRSVPMLDDAAINAVSQWEFTPTLVNGVPTPVVMTVTVNFTLS